MLRALAAGAGACSAIRFPLDVTGPKTYARKVKPVWISGKSELSTFTVDVGVYMMSGFERVYRKHVDAVFRYALRCVGRREIAEEITSEAFLELYRHLDTVDESQLPAWLLTVAKHRAVDYWRRQQVERRYRETLPADPIVCQSNDKVGLFDNESLKPIHRVCLILRYAHGMDRTEIAQRIGLTADQVKSRLQYARRLLREQFRNHARRGAK